MEVREIPPHVTLPQVTPKHVESYVRRLRRRQRLLSRLASLQAGKAQEEAEERSLEPSPRGEWGLVICERIPGLRLLVFRQTRNKWEDENAV